LFQKLLELFNMKNIVVRPGDTLSKLILLEYGIDNNIDSALLDCLVKYIGYINGYDLSMLDNINSGNYTFDPDSLQPGKVLMFPNTLEEAFADRMFSFVSIQEASHYAEGFLLESFIEPGSVYTIIEKYVNSKDVSIEGLPYGTHYKSKKKYVLIPDE